MSDLTNARVMFVSGLNTKCTVGNVTDAMPTLAQAVTEFGAAAVNEPGFLGTINDAAGGINFFLVAGDGTNYFGLKMTKLS